MAHSVQKLDQTKKNPKLVRWEYDNMNEYNAWKLHPQLSI